MARRASSSSSAILLGLVLASPLGAQSTQLTRLETSAPAATIEPVASAAWRGWSAAWVAPAAGTGTGIMGGLEQSGFASVSSVYALGRFEAGAVWQVSFAQTRVTNLFDPDLVSQFPDLNDLHASATQVGADAIFAGALSLGARYERDELVGDVTGVWIARSSGAAALPLGLHAAAVVERALSGAATGAGRLTLSLGRRVAFQPVTFDVGLGARLGDVWASGSSSRVIAGAVQATIRDLVSVSAAIGSERMAFGVDGWQGYASFGLGLKFGGFSADVRRGGQGDAQAAPTAVSLLYKAN